MNESKAASSYTMYQTCNVCTYVESAVEGSVHLYEFWCSFQKFDDGLGYSNDALR